MALTDSNGAVQTSYSYEPFGKTTASGATSSNPTQYTGRENDSTGIYYYRARYYSPSLQRFISEDPIGQVGGLNIYAYAGNNPISFSDPSGLSTGGIGNFAHGFSDATNPFAGMPGPPPGVIDGHVMPDLDDYFGPANPNSICYKLGHATGVGLMLAAAIADPVLGMEEEMAGAEGAAAREAQHEAGSGSKSPCFTAGTLVLTATGYKPIEQIAAGEQVVSTDPVQAVTATQTVSRTFARTSAEVVDIRIGGITITATPEHPFWVEGQGWRAAGELAHGAKLRTKDGGIVAVESVAKRRGEFAVYNLEVTSIHSYYVSQLGVLVHNQCGRAGGGGSSAGGAGGGGTGSAGGGGFNPFNGKTPDEIDNMFRSKGYSPSGPDPKNGLVAM